MTTPPSQEAEGLKNRTRVSKRREVAVAGLTKILLAGVSVLVVRWRSPLVVQGGRINCPTRNRPRSSIVRQCVMGRVMRRRVRTPMETECQEMATTAWNIAMNISPSLLEIVRRRCFPSLTVRGNIQPFWTFIAMVINPSSSMSRLAPPSTRPCKRAWQNGEE